MKRLLLLLLLALPAFAAAQLPLATYGKTPEGAFLPDPKVTPGVANPRLTTEVLCAQTFRTRDERNVTIAKRRQVCRLYGVTPCDGRVEIDHLISLELGGTNDIQNLWPQPYDPRPGAREKDVVETWLHVQICSGAMSLEAVQQQVVTNWYALYLTRSQMKAARVK